jgi:hypothetical protein
MRFIFFITRFSTITILQDFVKDLQVYKANIFKLYYLLLLSDFLGEIALTQKLI